MKKLFLLSVCLIGLGLTACQKDEMPEAPAAQTEEAVAATPVYSFDKSEVSICLFGGISEETVFILENGNRLNYFPPGEIWFEDIPGYQSIKPYVYFSRGFYKSTIMVGFNSGARYGFVSQAYLKFRSSATGQTISVLVKAYPHGSAMLD